VQTFLPRHEVLQSVLHADPSRAAKVEMSRRELLGLPPFAALAAVPSSANAAGANAVSTNPNAKPNRMILLFIRTSLYTCGASSAPPRTRE